MADAVLKVLAVLTEDIEGLVLVPPSSTASVSDLVDVVENHVEAGDQGAAIR